VELVRPFQVVHDVFRSKVDACLFHGNGQFPCLETLRQEEVEVE
jgi:hypothetical protein